MKASRQDPDWRSLVLTQPAAEVIPNALRQQAKFVQYGCAETLFRTGDPVSRVMLVLSGEVRLVRLDRNGREVILQRSRGGFIAEASLDQSNYHCDAVAAIQSAVVVFPVKAFTACLDENLLFRNAWQALLAREVRKLRSQCERLSLPNAAERIAHYIESEGSEGVFILLQLRKTWAMELGLTHEALYRALRRMQDDGTLFIAGNRFSTRGEIPANV
jgi:CRP/FNR family transcriptional regulator, dissimilatory nitrate respiration regulator